MESMAMELDRRCPICLDSWDNAAYVMPCLHQFCYECILLWAQSKPECPLCKRRIRSIMHSVWADEGFDEHVIPLPAASAVVGHQAGEAPGHPDVHSPAAAQLQSMEMVPRATLGGLQPSTWASLFQDHPAPLQPLLTWVQQELGRLSGTQSSWAGTVEDLIRPLLVFFRLGEDILVQLLGLTLQTHAVTFMYRLIDVAMQRRSGEAHGLLGLEDGHAAGEQEGSPVAAPGPDVPQGWSPTPGPAPSSSPEGDNMGDRPSTSAAALRGGPVSPPSAPLLIPREQQEPQEEPEGAVPRPSSPSRGRERSPRRAQRAPRRRASSPQASSPAAKRPPHRQH